MRAHRLAAALCTVALVLTACGSSDPVSHLATSPWSSRLPTTLAVPSAPAPPPRPSKPAIVRTLPRGGQTIIGHYRVVAYYGEAGNPQLGVLGTASPDQIARSVTARARGFARYGLPVQPAMELIATVAQGSPQTDGSYSRAIPLATVRRYLAVAHRYRMLLLLDLQPGRSTFLRQARALGRVLLDPSVGLGLDPEWKVTRRQRPGGGRIGSSGPGDINATIAYVSSLVSRHRLPHKLLVVHEFTPSMLPHRSSITRHPGVDLTFHADGFGGVATKINVFRGLHFPGYPFGVGIKLFLKQDARLMTPAEVMRLTPRPDVITYQ
ncbi:hypothetical protein [uncultured Jatrophihabitans sp.]|uniref:hypothetical protein n=1 Tax=uncultured Jatrophihabitans sp. TaxID=1610747 RepID=UPI0035CA6C67